MKEPALPEKDTKAGAARADRARLAIKPPRLFRGSDFREAFLVALSAATVMTRPVEKWAGVSERFYSFERGLRSRRFRRFRNRVAAFFGPEADDAFASQLWRAHRTSRHRRRLQIVAERLGSGYRPEIQFEGRERLDAALAHGRGVILWLDNFMHHAVIGKRPFADAGYISWQLSSVDHGFSRSRFGHAFLNPIQLSVEESYVAARVEFDGGSALAATREVGERLAVNGIVRITNNAYLGRCFVNTPFGASAWLSVATTPLNFARKSGAVLLPVGVFENVPFRRYSVTIGEPLPVGSGDRESAFRNTALLYAAYLEPLVRAHPEQWLAWQGPIDQPPPD